MSKAEQNIVIRMPNWLGDVVMATGFINAINDVYPAANVDLIMKKGLEFLHPFLPPHRQVIIFDKATFPGAGGALKFGKSLRKNKYDYFFCLPNSFSSALLAYGTKAAHRIGFTKEWRNLLLTDKFAQPRNLHRAEEYIFLLEQFAKQKINTPEVSLSAQVEKNRNQVVININSEASSRRLPVSKAISLIDALRKSLQQEIVLIGSPKEKEIVGQVFDELADRKGIRNMAGVTSMIELIDLLAEARVVLSTDSGPAHVANALGTKTIVLFGAGNEKNTAPYDVAKRSIIRLGKLPCEPCLKNECPLYPQPECLLQLDEQLITNAVKNMLDDDL